MSCPENMCMHRKKESPFPFPSKYIEVARQTNTKLNILEENSIDDLWNIDGRRTLSESWSGSTRFRILNKRPAQGATHGWTVDCAQKKAVLLQEGWEKEHSWECLRVHRQVQLFFSVFVDDVKLAGTKASLALIQLK